MKYKKNALMLLPFLLVMVAVFGIGSQIVAQTESDVDDSVTSSADIIKKVEQLAESDEITDTSAVYSLRLHLMAVGQFEKQDKKEKVIKHMNGFKSLIDHQFENELISEEAHQALRSDADDLIREWDSLEIVRDGEAHAVVIGATDQKNLPEWSTWNDGRAGSNGNAELAPGISYSGYAGASINRMVKGAITQRIEMDPNVETGPFEFSVYYYTASKADSKVKLEANFRDENDTNLSHVATEEVPTADTAGEWQKITLRGEIPETISGKKVATIQVAIHVIDGQDGTVYVDDALFYQEDENNNLLENPGFEEIDYTKPVNTLIDYIQESTGVTLPVVAEEAFQNERESFAENVHIYVGMSEPDEEANMEEELENMDGDGFLIRPQDNTITIIGPTELGTQNGVYDFLERFVGVRWLAPSEEWEHVPQLNQLSVPNKTIKEEPDFPFRSMNLNAENRGEDIDYTKLNEVRREWNLRNRMQSPQQLRLGHNLFNIVPPSKYGESNPEFYPNGEPPEPGVNAKWQPCFTEEGTIDVAVSEILDYFEKNPEETSISLAVNDSGGYCETDPSHPDYPDKRNSIGLVDMSDIYYDWVNQVVEQVLEVYPDKWFGLYAYQQVMDPPSFPVNDRVVPVVTKDRLAWIDDDIREQDHQQAEEWNEVANLTGWYEYLFGPQFFVPRVYPHVIAENYRYAKENNILTHHGDNHPSLGDFPKLWLSAKLQWDVDQDVDALLQDWYEAAVGPEAAPDLASYEAIWENFWTNRIKESNWFDRYKNDTYMSLSDDEYLSIVTDEEIHESRQLLESVVEKAATPEQQVRAEQILHQFEFYEASALSFPRQLDRPENEEMVLDLLSDFEEEIDVRAALIQKREDLYEEYAESLSLQYPYPFNFSWIQGAWTEWNPDEFWYVVDYIEEHEPSGGAVTERLEQMENNQESEKVRSFASIALKLLDESLDSSLTENPSFEEGNENASGWDFWNPEGSAHIQRVEGTAASGNASILFENTDRGGVYQTHSIDPGLMASRVSYYTPEGTDSEGVVQLVIEAFNEDGDKIVYRSESKVLADTAGEWSTAYFLAEVPEKIKNKDVDHVLVNAQVHNAAGAELYQDDLVVYQ